MEKVTRYYNYVIWFSIGISVLNVVCALTGYLGLVDKLEYLSYPLIGVTLIGLIIISTSVQKLEESEVQNSVLLRAKWFVSLTGFFALICTSYLLGLHLGWGDYLPFITHI